MTFVSYAQNYEDVMLWRALKHIESGFYIDIGAAGPDEDSVTKAFYERNWNGINIEPNPNFYSQLVDKRPRDINLALAISTQSGTTEMSIIEGTGLSTLDRDIAKVHSEKGWSCIQITVNVETLASVWKTYVPKDQEVHFLKIDVETHEKSVLESNDWEKNRPWIVVIESTLPSSQIENHQSWEFNLLNAQYSFVYADGLNRFYLANEHSGLTLSFSYPPNVFDGFQMAIQCKIEAELNRSQELNQLLQEEISLLINSRSMRITKPLRQLLNLIRTFRYWIREYLSQYLSGNFSLRRLSFENTTFTGSFFISLFRLSLNNYLKEISISIYANSSINRTVKKLAKKVPKLEAVLRRIYAKIAYSTFDKRFDKYPRKLSHLPPTARRIYLKIKVSVDKYHRGN